MLNLWLIDRSGYESAFPCRRRRYLMRHAGPHGYGWQRKAQSIPTLTGGLIHAPLAEILAVVQAEDRLPTDAETYAAIQKAQAEYRQVVEARGLAMVVDEAELQLRMNEQLCLLEGLVWTFVRVALKGFHQTYRVVSVEEEATVVLGCTCGLGDEVGAAADHDARECQGIGWMTRADCVAQAREGGAYSYHEFKTTGEASMNWEAQWYEKIQLFAGARGVEARDGIRCDSVYIHALIKGKNSREWDPAEGKASGPKYQNSKLVYAGRRAANPPLLAEDWAFEWKGQYYPDPNNPGKRKRQSADYPRTGLWEFTDWEGTGALSGLDYWTAWIGEALADSYRCIGPIDRAEWKVEEFFTQLVNEERRWQETLAHLYDFSVEHGCGWGDPLFMAELDRLVPMARGEACKSFFGDSCPMLPLCNRHDGWEDPALMGMLPRRPHHEDELVQAVGRGLLPPDEGAAELEGEAEER